MDIFVSHLLYIILHYITSNLYFILLHGEDMPLAEQQSICFTVLVSLMTYTISEPPVPMPLLTEYLFPI